MAVPKNLFMELTTDPLTGWQQHGDGAQTATTLEPDCSFSLSEELTTDKCWLIEAVVSVNAAPLDPDGARLWARFQKHASATDTVETGSMEIYSVQVRLEDDDGTKQIVLYDMAPSPHPVAVATLVLDQGWDWTDNVPRVRVRLRLEVDDVGATRTLHLEAEPSDDPLFDRSAASLRVSKDLDEAGSKVGTRDGSGLEVGFGNFGTESSDWESVHVSVADKGTALPYWPAPVEPDTDRDTQVDAVPGYRIFSPGLGEATLEFDCQDTPLAKYVDGDRLTLSLEVSQGAAPADRAYSSVPAGLDSHTFTGLDDEQRVTGKARVCDLSGRCTERQDSVVVDNSGPTLTITDVSPQYAQAGAQVVVEFTSNEPLDADTIQVSVGTGNMTRDGLGTTPYRYVYGPTDTDPQGPQTVVVQANDPSGNPGQDTNVGDVNFDFIVPTIDGSGASVDTPFVSDGQIFKLYVEVSDVGSDVDLDAFDVTLVGRPLSYVDRTGSTFEFEYAVDAAMDSAGPQSIEVRARDLAGNEAVNTLIDIVTFDFDPPIVAVSGSPAAPVGDESLFSITLTVTDDDSSVDDTSFTVTVGGQTMGEGTFAAPTFEFTHTASSSTSLEGAQDIVVRAWDHAGNETTQTFDAAVLYDFTPPVVALEDTPSSPVGDGALVHVTLEITDLLSDIDTGATFVVSLGGRAMYPGGLSHPSYPFSLTVNSDVDTDGAQDLVVTVRDTAGNETTETFPAAVSYDFVGPVVTIDTSPATGVTHNDVVNIALDVTDDHSQIDIGLTFVVTLGGREMDRDTFDHPRYPFFLRVDNALDSAGPQDLVVAVRDAAGNETTQTFRAKVLYDFGGTEVVVDASPATPVGHDGLVSCTLNISDDFSHIDTGATFVVTLGGREMDRGTFAHPSYPFSINADSEQDSPGGQNLVVSVHNTAGVQTVQTFTNEVTYDFDGPRITVDGSPAAPVAHGDTVSFELSITDDLANIDPGSTFVVTLGGRAMRRGTFAHPYYHFSIDVDNALDLPGEQDLVVTVRDTAGNETVETALGLVTYDLVTPLTLVNDKITLVCARGDDGLFHQQYDPELQITGLPTDDTPYDWELKEVVEWNDIAGGLVTVTIDPYADTVWRALPDGDPRREAIRLTSIVPVKITVPDAVWLEESDPTVTMNPWIRFNGTVNGDPFSVKVFLRTLTADDFLVFENQDRAGLVSLSQASEPGTPYTWDVEPLARVDAGFAASFAHDLGDTDHLGARIEINHTDDHWPALGTSGELLDPDDLADTTFHLRLSQPGHVDSYLHCDLRLRKLIGDRHLVFFGQVYQDDHPDVLWKESAVIAGPDETFSGRVVHSDGEELSTQPVELNELLGLASTPTTAPPSGAGDPPWNEDQTFNLRIQTAQTTVVPASYFNGRGLHFREMSPETLTIADRLTDDYQAQVPGPHVEPITVAGSAETWVFGDLDTFDLDSDLDADRTTLRVITPTLGITWEAGDLQPRETGELAMVLLRADNANVPLSPPVRVWVPVEITRATGLRVGRGTTTDAPWNRLPDAFHDLRYKAELEGLVFGLRDGDLIEWTLVNRSSDVVVGPHSPLTLENPGEQEYEAGNPDKQAQYNVLQTRDKPVADVIPRTITAQQPPYTLVVNVTHLRPLSGGGFKEIAGVGPHDLKLAVHQTSAHFDVAILLDRSGSMGGNRWRAACDGVDLFATLIHETGVDNRVGIYWCWGDDDNVNAPTPDNARRIGNQGDYGTFPAAASTPDADKLNLLTNRAVAMGAPHTSSAGLFDVCHADGPDHRTTLGSGLLHCRDELMDRSGDTDRAGNPRGRRILLVSDGMENCEPKLGPVFFDAPDEHWNLFRAPGEVTPTVHPEGPGVRIHSVAMPTSDAWAARLQDVAAQTGGLWALDGKHLRPGKVNAATPLTQSWFLSSFVDLSEFDESAVMVERELKEEHTVTQKLAVNLAMDTMVFYHLTSATDLNKWAFTVKLPDTDLELTPDLAAAHDAITYRHGKMYQMYVVRLGLAIPGHEHRWAGDWTLKLKRMPGTSTGHYGLGALSRQDLQCRVDVLTKPRPRPGDEATISVQLRDRHGNHIRRARVSTKVASPGPWTGDAVARRVSTDPALVRRLRKSSSRSNRDVEDVTDRVLRHMVDKDELTAGRTDNRHLTEVSPGLYQTRIKLTEAGQYQLDTTVRAEQRFSAPELTDLLRPHLRRLQQGFPGDTLTKELRYLRQRYTTRQPFSWAATRQVGVVFEPNADKSPAQGWFTNGQRIRLEVAPTDKRGRLLGPGWAEQLTFTGPAGHAKRWAATDNGDGHYWVEIPFAARNPRFEPNAGSLAADRLELLHPEGKVHPQHNHLSLTEFAVEVLGVRLPMTVRAPRSSPANK
jgi:Big-like domain-containing protein